MDEACDLASRRRLRRLEATRRCAKDDFLLDHPVHGIGAVLSCEHIAKANTGINGRDRCECSREDCERPDQYLPALELLYHMLPDRPPQALVAYRIDRAESH